jgi:hypothetical protein
MLDPKVFNDAIATDYLKVYNTYATRPQKVEE